MSSNNGTAPTLLNGPADQVNGQANGHPVRGAGDYVRGLEDTAPLDVVDRPGHGEGPDVDPRALVRELAERVDAAEDVVKLTGRRALIESMTREEVDAEREVAQLRREADREYAKWEIARDLKARKGRARRSALRRWLDERAETKDRNDATDDRRWHVRAQRARKKLTSLDARIATQIRSATRWSNALISVMIVGLVYTGVVVQHNFVPDGDKTNPLYWLSLGLEAMASLGLMALMRHDARAALAGMARTGSAAFWGWVVKGLLLLASLAAAAGPAIKALDGMGMIRTGWAPVLVAGVLIIHDRIARGDSEILAKLSGEAEREGLRDLVVNVEFALAQGLLAPSQDNGPGEVAPSASKIAQLFRINKADAGAVRDEVNARAADVMA
uniref:ORF14 n=1 Tax=Amycolatopsis benzoatilytica TaxID=346045 RepID=A3FG47_9PSEU|nr:ORF14 [Amycolatopsis benzoatilytica]